jgi:hypothetical protein
LLLPLQAQQYLVYLELPLALLVALFLVLVLALFIAALLVMAIFLIARLQAVCLALV